MIIYSKATSGRCLIDAACIVINRTRDKFKTICARWPRFELSGKNPRAWKFWHWARVTKITSVIHGKRASSDC